MDILVKVFDQLRDTNPSSLVYLLPLVLIWPPTFLYYLLLTISTY